MRSSIPFLSLTAELWLPHCQGRAVAKIREFILQKVYSFRKPMTNYQIPQNALLKYRFFYQFLLGHERLIAKEVRDEYVDTMSKIYLSYFKSYTNRLMKLQYEEVAEKDDLMGVEDTGKKGFFSKPSLRSRNTIFTLGNRGNVISSTELEGPIIVPHSAQKSDVRFHASGSSICFCGLHPKLPRARFGDP
ncbi:PREDICTED: vacuolar protein sorting-associated protein 52 homolog [Thamnophis sirtalis]|uniref:Vacuolar protein sorting-associated protein 52 homolog n=1 Tax=Thamnophis sirtalis TaxID=35019 RepID=A0A6I9YU27_9SAUR|nr:PREDICTED: vacuolar protein sorting-associated protein 52 homolog [Thamnophis sirtalis]